MKESLEAENLEDRDLKPRESEFDVKRGYLGHIGRQAERELFGMLIKEKELRKA